MGLDFFRHAYYSRDMDSKQIHSETLNGIRLSIRVREKDGKYLVFVDGIMRAVKPTWKGADGVIRRIAKGL